MGPVARASSCSLNDILGFKPARDSPKEAWADYAEKLENYSKKFTSQMTVDHMCPPAWNHDKTPELYDTMYMSFLITFLSIKYLYPNILKKTKPIQVGRNNAEYVDSLIASLLPMLRCHPSVVQTIIADPLQIIFMVMFSFSNGLSIVERCNLFLHGYKKNKGNKLMQPLTTRDLRDDPSFVFLKDTLDQIIEASVGKKDPWFEAAPAPSDHFRSGLDGNK